MAAPHTTTSRFHRAAQPSAFARAPEAEAQRLEAIERYAVLDTAPEQQYDVAVEIAARLAGAPMAALNFVGSRRTSVKAAHGLPRGWIDRAASFAQAAIDAPDAALVVPDVAADSRFTDHPWVAGKPEVRFCVAVPLVTPGGLGLGALMVLDSHPRNDGHRVAAALAPTARLVGGLLEARRESVLASALTCVVDFEGRFVCLSRAWEAVLALPRDQVVGRHFMDFVHPDDAARTAAELDLNQQGGSTRGHENRYVGADGRTRWLAWDACVVAEEQRIYAVAKDITDLKRGELALRESEERYRTLAETATDIIARHGFDGRVEYVSPSSQAVLGYSPDELAGIDPYELINPEDAPAVRAFHEALLNGTERVRMVFRERHRDGHDVWVESMANLLRDGDGEPVGIQTVTRDISDSKRSTEALQQAEERFRKAFEDAPIGMAILTPAGDFQRVNRALSEMVGYTETELLASSITELTHTEDVRSADEIAELLEREARAVTLEKRLVRRDGSAVWVSASVSLMRDAYGRALGVLAQFLDVSERHRAELEARRAREAAERANRAKSAFLARMSHELRTPLNAILGFAQLLELDELTPEQRDSAARIVRGGAHLVALIDDVLDISRIEAGEMSIDLGSVALPELVEEVTSLLRPLARERGVTLRVEGRPAMHARADRQRLKQVLLNLVSNAIKYGPEGSEVLIGSGSDGDRVRVAVTDQGPGLTAEDAERVFRPFERLPAHAHVEGTGLGLALSRNLARAMGGDIGVRAEDPGSEFWVELEAAEPQEPAPARRAPELPAVDPADDTPRTLLYVEDSPSNVEFTRRLLERRPNVELLVAGDLESGRRLAHDRHPDAILLDVDLPDGDGGDLLAELKADPGTADIPVVVVSADARRSQEERVIAAGAAAYAAKPVEVSAFMSALDAALAG
jgi:PAS domain S-box-containing protein